MAGVLAGINAAAVVWCAQHSKEEIYQTEERNKNNNIRNDRFFRRTDERKNELLQALRIETKRGIK